MNNSRIVLGSNSKASDRVSKFIKHLQPKSGLDDMKERLKARYSALNNRSAIYSDNVDEERR